MVSRGLQSMHQAVKSEVRGRASAGGPLTSTKQETGIPVRTPPSDRSSLHPHVAAHDLTSIYYTPIYYIYVSAQSDPKLNTDAKHYPAGVKIASAPPTLPAQMSATGQRLASAPSANINPNLPRPQPCLTASPCSSERGERSPRSQHSSSKRTNLCNKLWFSTSAPKDNINPNPTPDSLHPHAAVKGASGPPRHEYEVHP